MKKQSRPPRTMTPEETAPIDPVDPSATVRKPLAEVLDPSEINLAPLESGTGPELSTMAVPVQELDQAKTADIPPDLLPAKAHASQAGAQPYLERPETSLGSMKLWLGLTACLLVAGGVAAYWFLRPDPAGTPSTGSAPGTPAAAEAVPPELRSYMGQAKAGDAKAMHLIALMYWNGLNVRQDRAKGLEWYRKAAAAGDKAAQKELSAIEGK